MTEKMAAFLKEAEKDEALVKALETADSPEAVIALAAEKGLELSAEDLTADKAAAELDDEELDEVAGGRMLDGRTGIGGGTGFGKMLLGRLGLSPSASPAVHKSSGTTLIADDLVYRDDGSSAKASDTVFRSGILGGKTDKSGMVSL